MNAHFLARRITYEWISTAIGVQAILLFIAFAGPPYFTAIGGNQSSVALYGLLNLALVIGLSFAAFLSPHFRLPVRWALVVAAIGFSLLFLNELSAESSAEDWRAFCYWIVSGVALAVMLWRQPLPSSVKAALIVAIFCQGMAVLADLLDDGKLSQDVTGRMMWLSLVSLPISMFAYQVSFQYLVQATMLSALAVGRADSLDMTPKSRRKKFGDAFSVWKTVLPNPVKFRSMVAWYNLLARIDTKSELLFLNHGYDPPLGTERLSIPTDLERFRYPIQLYDLLARRLDWRGKDALEVSSGLGGGTLWISRTYSPRSLTGLDIAAHAVRTCRNRYGHLGIAFEAGDAQAMPFADASFDIIINVESSLNYPDMAAFLHEVQRVLRPGGYFLFADYRSRSKIKQLRAMLTSIPFEMHMLEDITPGILLGLEREERRKKELIDRKVPNFLKKSVSRFAGLGMEESGEYHKFASRKKEYIAAVLHKRPV
ncbi:MAG: class I SAM-dependent methyltransferase [Alphaproteobacteria bacterium]|nr:MAG: class I SAM-dependent methyltransferase [Alphaproteobacteria bacterium]